MTVLIADDSSANRKVLSAVLSHEGFEFREASDGVEALEVLRREPIHAVVSDVLMPKMDGYRLCAEVRGSEEFGSLPFVFYTSTYLSASDEKFAVELGADKFIRKPAPGQVIVNAIHELLTVPRRVPPVIAAISNLDVKGEYTQRLVEKLEEKNEELHCRTKELRETSDKLQAVIHAAPVAILSFDREGKVRTWNLAAERIFGWSEAEVIGQQPPHLGAKNQEEFEHLRQQVLAGERITGREVQRYRRDGAVVYLQLNGGPLQDADGNIVGMMAVFADVTDRKKSEVALRASEERFRQYFELGLIGMAITSPTKGCLEVNDEICRILGYERSELLRMSWAELTHPDDLAADAANFDRVMAGEIDGYSMDKRFIRKDGQIISSIVSARCLRREDGSVDYFVALLQDITERKRAEEALRESEHRHRQLVEALPAAVYTCDGEGGLTLYNEAALKLWGRRPEIGKQHWCGSLRIYKPDGRPLPIDEYSMAIAIREGRLVRDREIIVERPDGSRSVVLPHPALIRDAAGVVTGGVNMMLDITERRRSEEQLRKSEARLAEAEALAHSGNWEWNLTSDRVIWSDEKYRIMGLQPQQYDITYDFFLKCVHPDDRTRVHEVIESVLRDKQPASYIYRAVLPDGSVRVHETRATVTTDADGRPIRMFGTVQDITERRQTAEALQQANEQLHILSQRLFQVQEEERRHLARELHDQIGQGLTAAKINLQAALQSEQRTTGARRLDDTIALLDALTEKVRTLSLELRPPVLDDLGLVAALRWYLDYQAQIAGFQLEFFADPNLGRLASSTETACFRIVQEAVTNILRHAHADRVNVELRRTADALHLSVRDNGIGFDPESDRKSTASGTGLGMLGMRERVGLLGGEIDFKSISDEGVELHVFLPIATEASSRK